MKKYMIQFVLAGACLLSNLSAADADRVFMGGCVHPPISVRMLTDTLKTSDEPDEYLANLKPGEKRHVIDETAISRAINVVRSTMVSRILEPRRPALSSVDLVGFFVCVSYVLQNKEPESFRMQRNSFCLDTGEARLTENPRICYAIDTQNIPILIGFLPSLEGAGEPKALQLPITHLMNVYSQLRVRLAQQQI